MNEESQSNENNKAATAVATRKEASAPVLVGSRGLELTTLDEMWQFAQYVVASGFAPKGMETAASVLITVQMGKEVGLQPMQAIQNISVINGRPTVWGDAAKALVEASGICEAFDEWFEGTPYNDDFRAVCELRRRGRKRPVRWEFSVEDAKKANLWGKQGPWTNYPKRMLQMRPRGFAMRDAFPDVLKGLITAEEARDIPIDITGQADVETIQKPRTLDREAQQAQPRAPDRQAAPEAAPTQSAAANLSADPDVLRALQASGKGDAAIKAMMASAVKNGWDKQQLLDVIAKHNGGGNGGNGGNSRNGASPAPPRRTREPGDDEAVDVEAVPVGAMASQAAPASLDEDF